MNTPTPEQMKLLYTVASRGQPIIVGRYVTGKVNTGKKVNDKTGAAETWAGLQHAVQCGRTVVNVKEYVDRDPERFKKVVEAGDNEALLDKLLPCQSGAPCVVSITAFRTEKGQQVVTGTVVSL
jgi:hypothetical protein